MEATANTIDTLGGSAKVALRLGLPRTTVDTWRRLNVCPNKLARDALAKLLAKHQIRSAKRAKRKARTG